MKYWILGCALLFVSAPAIPQRHAMPRGSFLTAPARSTQALLRQYDTNAEVRRRYMNIFGRSREETRVILSRLKPKDLTASNDYPVAFYSESGKWTYRQKTLSKGTTVFVTPEGKPFLKEECGNPLVLNLPYPKGKPVASKLPIKLPTSVMPPMEVTVAPLPSPGALQPPLAEFQPPFVTSATPRLAELFPPEGGVEVSPEESPGFLSPPGVPVPPGPNPFLLFLLLPLLFIGGGGGGGSPPPPPPPPPVPEASSWVMMVMGGLGIGLVVWRERAIRST